MSATNHNLDRYDPRRVGDLVALARLQTAAIVRRSHRAARPLIDAALALIDGSRRRIARVRRMARSSRL